MFREEHCGILIAGAGPAGIAAACAAAESAPSVAVLDDNIAPGGQIWRAKENRWTAQLRRARVRVFSGTQAVASPGPNTILAEQNGEPLIFHFEKLILATGARELYLPFPGWTLAGVTGAGGLQALAQSGLPVEGKRVVIAGSGPLLLAVAAHLRARGAIVDAIAEQAPRERLLRFAAELWRTPAKIAQAAGLQWALRGVPRFTDAWPIAANGDRRVTSVTLHTPKGTRRFNCDYLACGFGLVANVELPALLGCELRAGLVAVDAWQRTSAGNIFCAGEPTGIGGVDRSLVEGRIAGYAAAGRHRHAQRLFAARRRLHAFSSALERAFALRDELRTLAGAHTIVCRCEDVTLEKAAAQAGPRAARLHARCGMGACQGRICGPALEFVLGRAGASGHARPPVFPVAMATLAACREEETNA